MKGTLPTGAKVCGAKPHVGGAGAWGKEGARCEPRWRHRWRYVADSHSAGRGRRRAEGPERACESRPERQHDTAEYGSCNQSSYSVNGPSFKIYG